MIEVSQTVDWIKRTNEKLQTQKDYLTSLDRKIGDGDHGINMARGFQEVANALENEEFNEVSDVLKKTALTVMSKVGGASGPLYGTTFLKMSTACKGKQVDRAAFADMVEAALDGIKQRGKAQTGEKTMIDVWSPVLAAMKENPEWKVDEIKEVAHTAMEETETMVATKGRAAYLKERSKGNLDPGSVSSYYLFEAFAEAVEGS